MKVRNGFVSNSSSSSFCCDICGRQESGWDLSRRDAEMFSCVNGHTICNEEAVMDKDEYLEKFKAENPDKYCEDMDYGYELPEALCPICSMLEFSNSDLMGYLMKKTGITEAEVFATVKAANKRRKKLYDSEYVMYALTKQNLKMEDLIKEIKDAFKSYADFRKACE